MPDHFRPRRLAIAPRIATALLTIAAAACASANPSPGEGSASVSPAAAAAAPAPVFDVRAYGARGDSTTLDSEAINRAIEAADATGGGTVYFPAGTYASFSIRLRSNITLHLAAGATLLAATPVEGGPGYDAAEPGPGNEYQDFGHSHWHNSLIWGENLHDVTIEGSGLINGAGLSRGLGRDRPGAANKAIALKLSRNVTIRDVSILNGGHFALLATGVDNLTIDNVRIDTNRDGLDIDACQNVRISNVSINSPNDDAIVLKSSYALGYARATENVTITNSLVSGYDVGSLLDGTFKRTVTAAPDRDGPTGRIKFGTESNGGFRNITISNVVFDRSRGLALETVDGALLEDVTITNITMREVSNAPFFLRLGSRMRGPEGVPVGRLRRVSISNVVVHDADPRYASIISGIPGHPIEDVSFSNIRIVYRGGLTMDDVARQPEELVNSFFFRGGIPPREPLATPEREDQYPEPSMFGLIPAYGFYVRHAEGVSFDNVRVGFSTEDRRPAFVLDDVEGASFHNVQAERAEGVPTFTLLNVRGLRTEHTTALPDTTVTTDRADF